MKIQAVCQKTGLSDRAIRFYMENKLVSPDSSESYNGRRSFEFSDADVSKLLQVATLRKAGFSLEEIRELFLQPEAVGDIVERRLEAVKRAAVRNAELRNVLSALKAEPITANTLIEALDAPMKEEKVPEKESEPPYTKMLRAAKRTIVALGILFFVSVLSFCLCAVCANMDYFMRYLQNGYTTVTVDRDGVVLSADAYTLKAEMNEEDAKPLGKGDGYSFKSDYGDIRGVVRTSDGLNIEYGFVHPNNWQNVRIHLSIKTVGDTVTVKQTIAYMCDERGITAAVNESTGTAGEKELSVYVPGLI